MRVSAKMMAIGLLLLRFLTTWRIPKSTRGVSCTKKNHARIQRQKALGCWECFALVKVTSIIEKYLKIMMAFNLLDLHHLLDIGRGTLKSWWARLERSSLRVGRMIAPKLRSPMIALNSSRVGHNSTPLNSVAVRRRGSFTLIWWKKEIQEKPRGMRASLKLRLSLLIHIETSKWVSSAIGDLTECFLGLNHVLWRFGSPLQLFYSERSRLWFFCLATCVHMVLIAYARSMPAYARARLCVPRFIRVSNSLSYLECGFLTKAFLMTSMA